MQKQIGAITLIAGTCIGSGMIALPLILAKLALIPSILVMIIIWLLMYFSALISIELHIKAKGLPIGQLGTYFNSNIARILGTISLKLLHFSLVAVYLYAAASVLQKLFSINFDISSITIFCAIGISLILFLPMKWLDYLNRILCISFLSVFGILLVILLCKIDFQNLPLIYNTYENFSAWPAIIPVLFTSFGFQGSMHTIVNYCDLDSKALKKAVFFGTLMPTLVYIIWIICVLGSLHSHSPAFFTKIIHQNVEVGELVSELANLSESHFTQIIVWWISFFAIVTSLMGVGRGLSDSIAAELSRIFCAEKIKKLVSVAITVIPSLFVALLVPNAFIAVLGFAGMILTMIAIIIPIYLFKNLKKEDLHYGELNNKSIILICAIFGILIILCELSTIF